MLALRSLSRLAHRSTPRIAFQPSRHLSVVARRPALSQLVWRQPLIFRPIAAFSSTAFRPQADELVAKLESEIQVERDISRPASTQPSSGIQDFLDNSGFQLHDTPGVEEVVLTRTVGDESIEVRFTIADLASPDVEGASRSEELDEFEDEGFDGVEGAQSGADTKAINQGRAGAGNVAVAPEDAVAPADRPEIDADEDVEPGQGPAFPARATVKITRAGQKGALTVECVAQDGDIIIDNVYYFPDAGLADPKTAEADWKRQNAYAGPPFGNLDEGLQIEFEKYLEERGVNTYMAVFIPDYIDFKEQREYVRWLENMKEFLA